MSWVNKNKEFWKNLQPEDIQTWIDKGESVDARDEKRNTPLHLAAAYNTNPEVFREFVDARANIITLNGVGLAPIHLALTNNTDNKNREEIIMILLDSVASVKDREGFTLYQHARKIEEIRDTFAFKIIRRANGDS